MHYDIIIIGTGAGGATCAHALSQSNKKILILERGTFIKAETENWDSEEIFIKNKYKTQETWFNSKQEPLTHIGNYCVGGSTKFFGGVMMRMRESDFCEVIHHEGISPAWPITYQDLEPYYTKAEALYKVHGQCGIDPTEPKFSVPYHYSPMAHDPFIRDLSDRIKNLGLQPFLLPLALSTTRENLYQGECIRCKNFDGFPCLMNAKSDADVIGIRPIIHKPNVTLLTDAYVTHLTTTNKGKSVKEVHANVGNEILIFSADIVIISCGAINSAALLLKSHNEFHPHGLGNSSGMVGRYYMRHNNSVLACFSRNRNNNKFTKTLGINDFYLNSEYGYPLGHIQTLGKLNGIIMKSQAKGIEKLLPGLVYEKLSEHSLDFWITSEDLPDPQNRISLTSNNNIVFNVKPNNLKPHDQLIQKLKKIIQQSYKENFLFITRQMSIMNTAHQCGTIRFGRDPKNSVLDINCKAHDLDNLYVIDGSFFVSAAAVNPSLTIIANALRVCDTIISL